MEPLHSDIPSLASVGERALIERIRSRVPPHPDWVRIGIGDDAAAVEPVRGALEVLTTDTMVEGVHWDWRYCSAGDVGVKCLAINLSDLASMGAEPRAGLLSLSLRSDWPVEEADAFLEAFAGTARLQKVAVIGGNVTSTPGPMSVTVTLTGSVRRRRVLTRSGGRPGDVLYVSGSVGSALAGLMWLRARGERRDESTDSAVAECVARYRRPDARVRAGTVVGRNRAANACMDLSDGLADAVRQIAEASGVGATIEAESLPISGGARRIFEEHGEDPVLAGATGGDDYELLFAVTPRRRRAFEAAWRQARGLALSRIGFLTGDPAIRLVRNGREEPLPEGFVHFHS
jgi:thiamine-monophosphate kinase